jgi:hypothetical protein
MTILTILGLVSFAFVVVFTVRAYRINSGAGQTPRGAIVEAWTNIAVGFALNYCLNWALLPLIGARTNGFELFMLGWVYTAAAIVRSYAIRRFNNAIEQSRR